MSFYIFNFARGRNLVTFNSVRVLISYKTQDKFNSEKIEEGMFNLVINLVTLLHVPKNQFIKSPHQELTQPSNAAPHPKQSPSSILSISTSVGLKLVKNSHKLFHILLHHRPQCFICLLLSIPTLKFNLTSLYLLLGPLDILNLQEARILINGYLFMTFVL